MAQGNGTIQAVAGIWALLIGIGLLMLGNGLQGSLLGVRAAQEGFGSSLTGLVMSGFFFGFLIGSRWTPTALRRVGHIRVFGALASLASISILVHSLFVDPLVWGLMRFITGLCYAGIFVVAESWLNDRAANETRGQMLSIYMVVTFLGMGAGQLMLNLSDPGEVDLFILVSVLISFAVVPILLSATRAPDYGAPKPVRLTRLYQASPLGVIGTFAAGLTNGSIFGMGAVYAHETGLSVTDVSLFMGALIAGAALLQWPIGRLSDMMDRRIVITVVTFGASLVAVCANILEPDVKGWLLPLAALMGGLGLTIHSLCLAYTNDYLETSEMMAASGGLVMVLGVGSIIGPLIAGGVMEWLGPSGFFWWLAVAHAGLGLVALYRMSIRSALPVEDQSPYVPVPARASPIAEAATEEVVEAAIDEGEREQAEKGAGAS